MYKIVMITAIVILAGGWIAYGIWRYRENKAEEEGRKPTTEHLQKVKGSFDDYIKKMEKFEKKTYERDEL